MTDPDLSFLRQRIRALEARLGGGDDGGMPPDLTVRVDRLERDVADIRATLGRLEPLIVRIDATVPALATKAELERTRGDLSTLLAEKPSKTYLWAVLAALIAAAAVGPGIVGLIR
jgi:hypothetical protein